MVLLRCLKGNSFLSKHTQIVGETHMTVVTENKTLEQVESANHMTENELKDFLSTVDGKDVKHIGQRILFVLSLVKEGDWSYEEGQEEIHLIATELANK